jgi:hypothetical protein
MILAAIAISFAFGVLVAAAVLLGSEKGSWKKCPECHWYHRDGGEFSVTAPRDGDGVVFTRSCPACDALNRLSLQKQFTRQVPLTLDGNQQQKTTRNHDTGN